MKQRNRKHKSRLLLVLITLMIVLESVLLFFLWKPLTTILAILVMLTL